mmetsp:Transcript_54414/g.115586  ORF Transcript_54414/g.115586 Transcript_54414/m.115586 type:complete len:227 (+) Transcript_54414:413-1093(+)
MMIRDNHYTVLRGDVWLSIPWLMILMTEHLPFAVVTWTTSTGHTQREVVGMTASIMAKSEIKMATTTRATRPCRKIPRRPANLSSSTRRGTGSTPPSSRVGSSSAPPRPSRSRWSPRWPSPSRGQMTTRSGTTPPTTTWRRWRCTTRVGRRSGGYRFGYAGGGDRAEAEEAIGASPPRPCSRPASRRSSRSSPRSGSSSTGFWSTSRERAGCSSCTEFVRASPWWD